MAATAQPSRRFLRLTLVLAIASLVLVLAVTYVAFARATITIFPKEEPVHVAFEVPLGGSDDPTSLAHVPGRIESVEVEGSHEIVDVNAKPIPDYAQVTVTIYNQQAGAQSLLPRTQLVNADGIKFRTDEAVTVPAGGSIQVGATADQPGPQYNIEPSRFTIIKLSSELQQLVYAESDDKATGGEKIVSAVLEDDIKAAEESLTAELTQKGIAQIEERLGPNDVFIQEAIETEVIDSAATVAPDTQTDSFSVTLTLAVRAAVFDENSLLQLAIAKLSASLPTDQELATHNPESFSYTLSEADPKKGTAVVSAELDGAARLRLPQTAFDESALTNKTRGAVQNYYRQFTEVDHVEVRFSPPWAFTVPALVDKISIEVGTSE